MRMARAGTDGAENIDPLVVCLTVCPRPLAAFSPDARQRALLTETRFVFEPDFDTLVRVEAPERFQTAAKVFLKSA